jgi:hypothetical protein
MKTNSNFSISKSLKISLLGLVLIACGFETGTPPHVIETSNNDQITLIFDQIYGRDYSESDSLQGSHDVLSRISQLILHDNQLLVLDRGFKKIVFFDIETSSIIGPPIGRYGRGPGEFLHPTAMSLDKEGNIYVFDNDLLRVTGFDPDWSVLNSTHIRTSTKSIIVRGDTIITGSLIGLNFHAAKHVPSQDSYETVGLVEISKEDLEFSPDGLANWIVENQNGDLIVVSGRPVVWYHVPADGFITQHGKNHISPIAASFDKNVGAWRVRGATFGAEVFDKDKIAVLWMNMHTQEKDGMWVEGFYLELYTQEGVHLGSTRLPHEWVDTFTIDEEGNYLYLAVREPYPHVARYLIEIGK